MMTGMVTRYGNVGTTELIVDVVGGIAVGIHGAGVDARGLFPPPSASTGSIACGYATVVEMGSPEQERWMRSMKTL